MLLQLFKKGSAAHDASMMSAVAISGRVFAFLRFSILMRLLELKVFGALQVVLEIFRFVGGVLEVRGNEALTRFLIEARRDQDHARCKALIRVSMMVDAVIAFSGFALLMLGSGTITAWTGLGAMPVDRWLEVTAVIFLCHLGWTTHWGILVAYQRFDWMARVQFLNEFSRALVPIVFYLIWQSVEAFMWGFALQTLVLNLMLLKVARGLFKGEFGSVACSSLKEELKIMWPFYSNAFVSVTFKSITREGMLPIVQILTQSAAISALLAVVMKLSSIVGVIAQPVVSVLYPRLTKMWMAERFQDFKLSLLKVTAFLLITCSLLALAVYAATPFYLDLVNKEATGDLAALFPVLSIFLVVSVILSATGWSRPAALAMNKPHYSTLCNFFILVLFLVGAYVLIPPWGVMGVALMFLGMNVLPTFWYVSKIGQQLNRMIKA